MRWKTAAKFCALRWPSKSRIMGRITGRLWDRLFLSSLFQRSSPSPVIIHLKWFQKNGISLYCFWPGDLPFPWAKNWRLLLYQPVEVSDIKYLTLGWHRLDFAVCSLPPSLLAYSTTQPFLWWTLNQSYLYLLKEQMLVLFSHPSVSDSFANPMDWNFPGKNTGIGFSFPFSSGSSQPRDWTHVSCIASGFFYHWAIGGALKEQILRCKVPPSCLPSLRKWQLS